VPIDAAAFDWSTLSDKARWTLQQIVLREELGWTRAQIAQCLGVSKAEIATRLADLRRELRAQAGKAT
jgi:DNA-directed RNA polymerase specialized sigma24 family protein